MTALDWGIIAGYLLGMIGLSVHLGRRQHNQEDYYVAGRRLPWWAIGISTMATQTSAISFISKPAFVALKPGGGLTWLQFELAVPLAVIVVMRFLLPFFRKLRLVSVYEYLEHRFDASVRYLVSGVFLISRGLAAGVVVYATAIVLSVCLDVPLWLTILIIGVVTVIYDTIGGMSAVVYSDVIQMNILLCGIILCIAYAVFGGWSFREILTALPPERLRAIDWSTGLNDGSRTPFWGILFGGFFLYISYYGTDQSQVQRELSAIDIIDTKRSLFFNGLVRFPLTASYMMMGIVVGAVYLHSPELQAMVPADKPDYLIPRYILLYIPSGVRAILFAAILAASMSTLDSGLNSLSAVTMRDFITRRRVLAPEKELFLGKAVTAVWGIFVTGFAFLMSDISGTVLEAINKIGSAFYGPILAAFLTGVLSRRANSFGIFAGILAGVSFNLVLWMGFPEIYWMWWNMFGCLITMGVAALASPWCAAPSEETIRRFTLRSSTSEKQERGWVYQYIILAGYFVLILCLLIACSYPD